MAELNIEHWDQHKDGELNVENMKKKIGKKGFRCTEYTFTPGTEFPDHTHNIDKVDAIIEGQMKFGMYGKEVTLGPGDTIEVPKLTVHNAAVFGNKPVVFLDSTK